MNRPDISSMAPLRSKRSAWPHCGYSIICLMRIACPQSRLRTGFATVYRTSLRAQPREAFPRYRPADRDHGGAAHARLRLPLGPRAELRDHRALYARGSLRGRRRHRPRRPCRPQGRAGRPAAAGGLPRPHGAGARRLRFRRRGRHHHHQAHSPPSPRLCRRARPHRRGRQRPMGADQGRGERSARRRAGRQPARWPACRSLCPP